MGTALDALATQPLNTRRAGAPTLPSFELPPPPFALGGPATSKYPPPPSHTASHPLPNVSLGNLLTPPATNHPDGHTASQALAPSTAAPAELPAPYWAGAGPVGWAGANPIYASRNSFSPTFATGRSSSVTSPPTTDGLSQPVEVNSLSSFPQALPAPSSNIPTATVPQPVTMASSLYPGAGTANSPATIASNDPYGSKAQPLYGGSPPLPGSYSQYHAVDMHPPGRMLAGPSGGQPSLGLPRQPWPSYSLPAMNGPVVSNVHSPNNPMSVMGGVPQPGLLPGFHSGHVASAQHLYGMHPPPHGLAAPAADRPFKCDQCPQSFNRNHDLKRHKRIHLAVKPFPCKHCDKTFSRKDALKRHILVKGCGKDGADDAGVAADAALKDKTSEEGSAVVNGHI